MVKPRGIAASQLAREHGARLVDFGDEVITLLARLDARQSSAQTSALDKRKTEICAAVWAANLAAIEASSLSEEERKQLTLLLREQLLPYWLQHCGSQLHGAALIEERSLQYLRDRETHSQVKTAARLVLELLTALNVQEEARVRLISTLTPLFAHRMLGDVHRLNDVRTRSGINLPVVAALCALVQLGYWCESLLRILRLV